MKFNVCSKSVGNDGIIFFIKIDNETFNKLIEPNKYDEFLINISKFASNRFHRN